MGLFDSPTHIIILLVVVLLLFGSSRLPGAAKALGQSMNIFKRSMRHDDDDQQQPGSMNYTQATVMPPAPQPPAQPAPPAPQISTPQPNPAHQAQIDDLQRQVADLQRASATNGNSSVSDATPSSSSN
jgi:sec-independent protein translocase protein TatA